MSRLNLAVAFSIASLSVIAPRLAEAHFKLVAPTNWWTQAGDGSPQKAAPCGNVNESTASAGTTATGVVNVYQPGQTVTVTVTATVAHFGWWRISLHEGAASTQTTTTLPDPTPTTALCVTPFIDNPVWSPTQPVIADKLGIPAGSTATNINQNGTQNYQVTIPQNAHCSMASPCTLQVVMIMTTDHAPPNCFYHHCADMMLAGGATGTGGSTGTADAGAKDASAGTGGKTGGTGGSMSTGVGGSTSSGTGGSATGTAGMTGGSGSGGAMAGSAGANGGGGSTTTGAGGASSGGQAGGSNGSSDKSSGGCAIGGGAVGSSSGLILLAILALRRRRARR